MEEDNKQRNKLLQNLYQYSSLGFQMAVIIGLGAWFGRWLDQKLEMEKGWFALLFVLLAIAVAIYVTLKRINNMNNDE